MLHRSQGTILFESSRHRWEDNIEIDIGEVGFEGVAGFR
jgi:hypothetical protein